MGSTNTSHRANAASNQVNDTVRNVVDTSKEFVTDHTLSATITMFGVGLATGVALVHLMSESKPQRLDTNIAHRVGQQIIDALQNYMPDTLAKLRG